MRDILNKKNNSSNVSLDPDSIDPEENAIVSLSQVIRNGR